MKTIFLASLAAASALGLGAAQAASIDVSPVVNEAINDILVPALVAVVPTVGALLVMPLRRWLDQKAGVDLATRVNDLLDKAIAYGAAQAEAWVTEKDFHTTVDGAIANIAVDYALQHAPSLLKKAGAIASTQAAALAQSGADSLLHQKVVARQAGHPAVATVKAMAAPAPLAAAA